MRKRFTKLSNKIALLQKRHTINFGPQHPAAHGVLRIILQYSGEIIEKLDIHIGLLHRSTEFLIQSKHYTKSIPYLSRLDYVSTMSQEHLFCLAIEQLTHKRNQHIEIDYNRILFDELTRILNHLLAVSCHALDVGNMSCLFWSFETREIIMEFYERVSGARLHSAYHKPSFQKIYKLNKELLNDIICFIIPTYKTLNEMHNLLTYNKIWKQRLVNIGTINLKNIQNYGLTGVLARSAGIKKDTRLSQYNNYSSYNTLNLKSFLGINGDTYDRYLIRMSEMGQSLNIINNVSKHFLNWNKDSMFEYKTQITQQLLNYNYLKLKKKNYSTMEDIINFFLNWHTGIFIKSNTVNLYIESPKGELGVSLISNNSTKPQKCKIRSPSYHHLQFLHKFCKNLLISDLTTLIGTLDIVFGEIDR